MPPVARSTPATPTPRLHPAPERCDLSAAALPWRVRSFGRRTSPCHPAASNKQTDSQGVMWWPRPPSDCAVRPVCQLLLPHDWSHIPTVTATQPHRRTAGPPHRRTAAQPHSRTAAQPHRCTAAQPHCRTTALPHSGTATQPHCCTAAPPHRRTAAPPVQRAPALLSHPATRAGHTYPRWN
eukprot:COSAG01_NODE_7740_length_3077_cov_5.620215_1_plen_181_part_00